MLTDRPIELLSPAGDFESLIAAIQGGADAVYFGIGKLNMRATATRNFQICDLPEIRKICDQHKIRAYLTLNTVMYDEDMADLELILEHAVKYQIDAVIASDMAVVMKANGKGLPVHLSTQGNISNFEALKHFAGFAEVIVLARELHIEQVKIINELVATHQVKSPSGKLVRIEAFIHGALCMSISGKCYLSLHEKNKSANRGECMQLCRRAYTVTEKDDHYQLDIDNEYIMSPKDLSTITFLDKILDSGISVLKIEGRGRSPEYVKIVTACYREAIEDWKKGQFRYEKAKELQGKLSTVYNRGFWEGYYMGKKSGEWSDQYGSKARKRKVYIGKITNYFSRIEVAECKIETHSLQPGDVILIIGPTSGVLETLVSEIRVEDVPVPLAEKGTICSIPINEIVRRSDKIYKWADIST